MTAQLWRSTSAEVELALWPENIRLTDETMNTWQSYSLNVHELQVRVRYSLDRSPTAAPAAAALSKTRAEESITTRTIQDPKLFKFGQQKKPESSSAKTVYTNKSPHRWNNRPKHDTYARTWYKGTSLISRLFDRFCRT